MTWDKEAQQREQDYREANAISLERFRALEIGDKLVVRSGMGDNRFEAEVTVHQRPAASVFVRIDKVLHAGGVCGYQEGGVIIAGRLELYES